MGSVPQVPVVGLMDCKRDAAGREPTTSIQSNGDGRFLEGLDRHGDLPLTPVLFRSQGRSQRFAASAEAENPQQGLHPWATKSVYGTGDE